MDSSYLHPLIDFGFFLDSEISFSSNSHLVNLLVIISQLTRDVGGNAGAKCEIGFRFVVQFASHLFSPRLLHFWFFLEHIF